MEDILENKEYTMNAIVRILVKNNIDITQNLRSDIYSVIYFSKFTMEQFNSSSDIFERIHQFIGAKKVDGLSAKTLISYKERLSLYAKFINLNVNDTTAGDIRRYLIYLAEERHLRETSIATEINILRSFFSWLFAEEVISKNPMLKIKSVKINKKLLRTSLTIEEIEKMRNSYKTVRDKALFELFYSSGCRLSEAVNLNISDIDFIEKSTTVIGKGNKPRKIYFSTRTKIFLQEYLHNRKGSDKALFIGKIKPYKRLCGRIIEQDIKRIGEDAKIERRVYPHVLRHSFATHALNSGMDINIIQALLGHEDINTTQIYAMVSNSSVLHEYNKLIF